jgi:hypothetical protein
MTTDTHVAKLSRNWNNGTNAGADYWNLNNSSDNSNRNIDTRYLCASLSYHPYHMVKENVFITVLVAMSKGQV